jgi:hypothetical protein
VLVGGSRRKPGEAGDQHEANGHVHADQHHARQAVGKPDRSDDGDRQRGAADKWPGSIGPATGKLRPHTQAHQPRQQGCHHHVGGADMAGVLAFADRQLNAEQACERPYRQGDDQGAETSASWPMLASRRALML